MDAKTLAEKINIIENKNKLKKQEDLRTQEKTRIMKKCKVGSILRKNDEFFYVHKTHNSYSGCINIYITNIDTGQNIDVIGTNPYEYCNKYYTFIRNGYEVVSHPPGPFLKIWKKIKSMNPIKIQIISVDKDKN